MKDAFYSRTEMLLGKSGVERLIASRVAIFGIGGVGGHTAEALARAGVGELLLVDSDTVSLSNINRQIFAARSTVGMYKTDAARERLKDINPYIKVGCVNLFFTPGCEGAPDLSGFDYIVDAIDSVASKVELAVIAGRLGIPIISAMGAGNKLDPTAFRVTDISKTEVCPLARAVRLALRRRGINHLKAVWSPEKPIGALTESEDQKADGKRAPGSLSFVPSVMGLIIAGEVIKDLSGVSVR